MSAAPGLRLAVWSGPRNISTAMMRAWGSRPDTWVCDEPLYAHYLLRTGLNHPGREEVIASQPGDWRQVADQLTGPIPGGRAIHFQKHMAHHLLPEIERDWLLRLTHCFLIRSPREMLLSLAAILERPGVADTGLPQQCEFYGWLRERGLQPAVLDAADVLRAPEPMLRSMCSAHGVEFLPEMLSWPPGRRDTDGAWAPHWYAGVERSTGFEPYRPREGRLAEQLEPVLAECEEYYRELWAVRLQPATGEDG